MRYAVIKTGGKQYKVTEGQVIEVERLESIGGPSVVFNDVLLVAGEDSPLVGTPFISNVQVVGKVMGDIKGEKIRVAKYKAKVRYRRVTGHRQSLTRIQIESIGTAKKSAKTEKAEAAIESKTKSTAKAAAK
jgi:large subunit ribosomal protein L21